MRLTISVHLGLSENMDCTHFPYLKIGVSPNFRKSRPVISASILVSGKRPGVADNTCSCKRFFHSTPPQVMCRNSDFWCQFHGSIYFGFYDVFYVQFLVGCPMCNPVIPCLVVALFHPIIATHTTFQTKCQFSLVNFSFLKVQDIFPA